MGNDNEIVFEGIDGGNPLGFLAALGAFRTTALTWQDRPVRLSWLPISGVWRPVLNGIGTHETEVFLAALNTALKGMWDQPALTFAPDLVVSMETFRKEAANAQAASDLQNRSHADFIAAFGSEATHSDERGREQNIQDTAFRTMSGAGHQHFLGFMRDLIAKTEIQDLSTALFHEWRYTDPGPSLRWDPNDDRRYALRWKEPSGDPATTVRGANRLAIEALPLFPTAPIGNRLETTGFRQRRGEGTLWTWPIWTAALPLDPIRSMLALSELQASKPDRQKLTARGIAEIFRSQRMTIGKYRNFTPAYPA